MQVPDFCPRPHDIPMQIVVTESRIFTIAG
jgi:5-formyltetrahydrofolate cyclo-ligase